MRFKQLKQKLNEWMDSSMTVPGLNNPTIGDGSIAPFRVEDEESRERINSFLKLFGTERYECPKQALVLLRSKMNLLGLDFVYDGKRKLNNQEVFTVTQYGGRIGMNDQGEFFSDDGISHRTGQPLELRVSIEKVEVPMGVNPMNPSDTRTVMSSLHYVRPVLVLGSRQGLDLPPAKSGAASSAVQGTKKGPYQPGQMGSAPMVPGPQRM